MRLRQERVLRPGGTVRHGFRDLTAVDPTGATSQILVQQREAVVCLGPFGRFVIRRRGCLRHGSCQRAAA
ncbi:hypothetical protein chiPu_0029859 [Chiloscyllium punctatum]|uniref:Uncharacterized protein n=1 Tax=Chiloscyllium punctatum TaxID=137246 RepID=A0A401TSE4_CHIPU|nr:hypothetical protein [Chiloscyllium punctatum]